MELTVLTNYYRLTEVIKNEKEVFEFYSKLKEITDIYYLNFVNSEIAYNEENFYNFTHLNLNGANKLSTQKSKMFNFIK